MHVLSTPPAFILSQDQTLKKMCLFQVQHKLTSLHIPFYCFKGSFDRSLNVPVSPGCLVQRIFEDCIYVFHCSVIKVLICFLSCDSSFNIAQLQSPVNNFFQLFYFLKSRFCCYSVAFCDSSYRIPLILRIVNMFFTFFPFLSFLKLSYTGFYSPERKIP